MVNSVKKWLHKHGAYIILGLVMIVSVTVMLSVSEKESVVVDEIPYIASGYSYLKYLDYRLDPEHPPLLKMAAAVPLLFLDLKFPDDISAWQTQTNGQWEVGRQFLFEQGNDADLILRWARTGPIVISLILIFFIYFWSTSFVGRWWSLVPTVVFALSPTILAHGHYVTTDVGTACGIFIALHYFFKVQKDPTWRNIFFVGLAFGVAELLKFSTLILIPYFTLLAGIFFLNDLYRNKLQGIQNTFKIVRAAFLGHLKYLVGIFLVGFALIYVVYSVVTINYSPERQKTDTSAILGTFENCGTATTVKCKLARTLTGANIWAADKPIIRPYAEYALGVIMTLRRTAGGGPSYFLGEISSAGRWYYFPLTYAMKEPLPVLGLLVLASGFTVFQMMRTRRKNMVSDYFANHREEFGILLFIILYMAASMKSPLNIGLRYIIPVIPLFYVLMACGLRNWKTQSEMAQKSKVIIVVLLLVWFAATVAANYPYYLSYFNPIIGTDNGWRYVTDSNYDWGQDVKRLKTFVEENNIKKIAVDCYPCGKPAYYLGDRVVEWSSAKGNPAKAGIQWLALSVNTLQNAKGRLNASVMRKLEDEYIWLQKPFEPYARVGTSIFIFKE